MQIHFLFMSSSRKFSACVNSVDFKTRDFIDSKMYFNKHIWAALEYLTLWDGKVHPEAVLKISTFQIATEKIKVGEMPSVLMSVKV